MFSLGAFAVVAATELTGVFFLQKPPLMTPPLQTLLWVILLIEFLFLWFQFSYLPNRVFKRIEADEKNANANNKVKKRIITIISLVICAVVLTDISFCNFLLNPEYNSIMGAVIAISTVVLALSLFFSGILEKPEFQNTADKKMLTRIFTSVVFAVLFCFFFFRGILPWIYTEISGSESELLVKVTGWHSGSGVCPHPEVNGQILFAHSRGLCANATDRKKLQPGTTLRLTGKVSALGINISKMEIEAERFLNQGMADFKNGQYQFAIENFSKAIRMETGYADAYVKRGATYTILKQYQDAIEDLNKAIKLKSDNAQFYFARGFAYFSSGQYQQALDDYNKAISLKPDNAEFYMMRGGAYVNLGQKKNAMEDMSKAVSLKPGSEDVYVGRGLMYANFGQFDRAIEDFNKALGLKPNDAACYYNRGNVYIQLRKYKEALEDYSKAISLKPDYVNAYSQRESVYIKLGLYQQAIDDLNKAISMEPGNAGFHLDLSETQIITGRPEQAEAEADKTLQSSQSTRDKAIGSYLKAVSRKLQGKNTAAEDRELKQLCTENFQNSWSFDEIEHWLKEAKITGAQKNYIKGKIALLRKHSSLVPIQNQAIAPPGSLNSNLPAPVYESSKLLVKVGDTLDHVRRAYHITAEPEPVSSFPPGKTGLRLENIGILVIFDREGNVDTIRLESPFQGSISGVRIGDSSRKVLNILGEPDPKKPGRSTGHFYYSDHRLHLLFDNNDALKIIFLY